MTFLYSDNLASFLTLSVWGSSATQSMLSLMPFDMVPVTV